MVLESASDTSNKCTEHVISRRMVVRMVVKTARGGHLPQGRHEREVATKERWFELFPWMAPLPRMLYHPAFREVAVTEQLKDRKCVTSDKDLKKLEVLEAVKLLEQIPRWRFEVERLHGSFTFQTLEAALEFVREVFNLAEAEGHHPDVVEVRRDWQKDPYRVDVYIQTHAVRGLTENDYILAAKIDTLRT